MPDDKRAPALDSSFLDRYATKLAAAALILMGALLSHAALLESPTIDEPNHVMRGLAFLSTGDARLSVAHPPLGNLAQGVPGYLLDRPIDVESLRGWDNGWNVGSVLQSYFARDYERARTALVGGRLITALLTVLLGVYLYFFSLRWGRKRALYTVLLYSVFPLFLAHGHLVTTDVPLALASTIAVGEFVRWAESRRWLRFATFSLAVGAAMSIKFSALFLIPALGLCGLVLTLRGGGPLEGLALKTRLLRLGRDLALVTLVAIFVVNASYGFQRTFWSVERTLEHPEPVNWVTQRYKNEMLEQLSSLPTLPSWLPIPLPYPWVYGLHSISAQNERGHAGWFMGSREPTPLYFPIMSVVKTPLAVLVLLGAALWLAFRRRRWPGANAELALWVAPLLLFVLSLFSDIQIGVRHLMPMFPFVLMGAGWALATISIRLPVVAASIFALAAAEGVLSAPTYLGHFSWAIGGPKVGHRINMVAEDWGQDIRALGEYANEHELEPLYYQPYGRTASRELRRFGVKFQTFSCRTRLTKPAWVAIHGNQVVRWKRDCGPIAQDRIPDAKVNEHIFLYWVDPKKGAAPPRSDHDEEDHDHTAEMAP